MSAQSSHGSDRFGTEDDRAERILSAARELLLRWGYKRVTVDDIARHAHVGKGTVYLHWKTKEELFIALLRIDSAEHLAEVVNGLSHDPAAVRPHQLVRRIFLSRVQRPITKAVYTSDSELLGALAVAPGGVPVTNRLGLHTTVVDLVRVLRDHGLTVSHIPAGDQVFLIDTILSGFVTGGLATRTAHNVSLDRQADLLAATVRAALEPAEEPTDEAVTAAASEVHDTLSRARWQLLA
ncbi:TetR/AcrR family transcriptional regulator [Streptomyces sp. NPDC090499]|uniref:TetR/AcrR family transcriptional regulator n=1 Tax=Streptomyces sp. NPDC090499 TaxID=3365965 RepID=UPI0037F7814F